MPVQAVEFAEYGRDGLSPLFGIAAGDASLALDFDTGSYIYTPPPRSARASSTTDSPTF